MFAPCLQRIRNIGFRPGLEPLGRSTPTGITRHTHTAYLHVWVLAHIRVEANNNSHRKHVLDPLKVLVLLVHLLEGGKERLASRGDSVPVCVCVCVRVCVCVIQDTRNIRDSAC